MNRIQLGVVVVLLMSTTAVGWLLGQNQGHKQSQTSLATPPVASIQKPQTSGVEQDDSGKTVQYWYDPMVPDQRFDKPGKSPFMDMQLVPKYASETKADSDGSPTASDGVSISSQTEQNLGIRIAQVALQGFGTSFTAVGRITPDERRLYVVQTRVPGFVEKLSTRAVGDPVHKGQKIAEIYAPELLAAQQEYLALLELKNLDADNALKEAAKNRLRLLGMTNGDIAAITQSGKSSARFGVFAPSSGVVTDIGVREGGQLLAGTSLIQVSDLSQVWVIAEVPEQEAVKLKIGMAADVQLQSLPGEIRKGKLSYLYPSLNETARTLQVRIELPNQANRLRPGMYANVAFAGQTHEALAVPTESVIATGKRKVVIVKQAHGYRPVEVQTGEENDHDTEILSGLKAGEQVVVSGQFLIDSEAALSGVLARLTAQTKTSTRATELADASTTIPDDSAMPQQSSAASKALPQGKGKVIAVDAKHKQLTLKHEAIEALGWPAMTMDFDVLDARQLQTLKAGDHINFDLKEQPAAPPEQGSTYVIVNIAKNKAMGHASKGAQP